MSYFTQLSCDECDAKTEFWQTDLASAERVSHNADWRTVEPGKKHLCDLCAWKHDNNHLAIDIDIKENGDYEVLAIVHDPKCLEQTNLWFGINAERPKLRIRRVEKAVYGTMKAFGIAEVNVETHYCLVTPEKHKPLFPNTPTGCTDDINNTLPIDSWKYKFSEEDERTLTLIDLSTIFKDYLAGNNPKMKVENLDPEPYEPYVQEDEEDDLPF